MQASAESIKELSAFCCHQTTGQILLPARLEYVKEMTGLATKHCPAAGLKQDQRYGHSMGGWPGFLGERLQQPQSCQLEMRVRLMTTKPNSHEEERYQNCCCGSRAAKAAIAGWVRVYLP